MWEAIGGLLGGLFGGGGGRQQQQDQYAQQLEQTQNDILTGMWNRAKTKYWPIEDVALPMIQGRAESAPGYATSALRAAKSFEQPIQLNYDMNK